MNQQQINSKTWDGVPLVGSAWEPDGEVRAAVCLIHGLGEHIGRYAHVAAALTEAGYALMGFDLRGHGKSGGPRGHTPSYEALMDDMTGMLDETAKRYPGKPRFLYGHSLGGNMALNYVIRCRPKIAGVIATGSGLRLAFMPPPLKMALVRLLDRVLPAWQQPNGLDRSALSHDPQVVRDYSADPLVHDKVSLRLVNSMLEAGEWAIQNASEFPLPLLLTHGGADAITSAAGSRAFAERAGSHCTYCEWEGLYHETHNEPQKAAVLARMIAWLDEQLAN